MVAVGALLRRARRPRRIGRTTGGDRRQRGDLTGTKLRRRPSARFPGPNGGAPPAFQINMGMVQGAVYDAVNAIGPKQHRPYLLNRRTGAKASIDAAVATAAYDVLSELVSTAPERAPFTTRAAFPSTLSSENDASRTSSTMTPSRGRASRSDTRQPRPCSTRERETDGSCRQRGCRTPRPDTGSHSSTPPRLPSRSWIRPRGRAT